MVHACRWTSSFPLWKLSAQARDSDHLNRGYRWGLETGGRGWRSHSFLCTWPQGSSRRSAHADGRGFAGQWGRVRAARGSSTPTPTTIPMTAAAPPPPPAAGYKSPVVLGRAELPPNLRTLGTSERHLTWNRVLAKVIS